MLVDVAAALRRLVGTGHPPVPGPKLGRAAAVALVLAASSPLCAFPAVAVPNVAPPAGSPKFLALPFSDPGVKLGQGWYYPQTATVPAQSCSHPVGDVAGWRTHCGMDYRKKTSSGNVTFEVRAAAAGQASWLAPSSGGGSYHVLVQHDATGPGGEVFCTWYTHVDPGRPHVAAGTWTRVNAGQTIAWAGRTGTDSIHLHLKVRVGGCGGAKVDPYDIADGLIRAGTPPTKDYYPGYAVFAGYGPNSLWCQCLPGPDASASGMIEKAGGSVTFAVPLVRGLDYFFAGADEAEVTVLQLVDPGGRVLRQTLPHGDGRFGFEYRAASTATYFLRFSPGAGSGQGGDPEGGEEVTAYAGTDCQGATTTTCTTRPGRVTAGRWDFVTTPDRTEDDFYRVRLIGGRAYSFTLRQDFARKLEVAVHDRQRRTLARSTTLRQGRDEEKFVRAYFRPRVTGDYWVRARGEFDFTTYEVLVL
jgi:hypothetical protein